MNSKVKKAETILKKYFFEFYITHRLFSLSTNFTGFILSLIMYCAITISNTFLTSNKRFPERQWRSLTLVSSLCQVYECDIQISSFIALEVRCPKWILQDWNHHISCHGLFHRLQGRIHYLPFPVLEAMAFIGSLVHRSKLCFCLHIPFSPSYNNPHKYIGPTHWIQDNLPFSRSLNWSYLKNPFCHMK